MSMERIRITFKRARKRISNMLVVNQGIWQGTIQIHVWLVHIVGSSMLQVILLHPIKWPWTWINHHLITLYNHPLHSQNHIISRSPKTPRLHWLKILIFRINGLPFRETCDGIACTHIVLANACFFSKKCDDNKKWVKKKKIQVSLSRIFESGFNHLQMDKISNS